MYSRFLRPVVVTHAMSDRDSEHPAKQYTPLNIRYLQRGVACSACARRVQGGANDELAHHVNEGLK